MNLTKVDYGGNMRWSYVHDPGRRIGTALGRRYASYGYWNFHQAHLGSTRFLTGAKSALDNRAPW
ncbi:hypothetical protein ACFL1X_12675 [Candidatus Hydrogenedentota bacterium]